VRIEDGIGKSRPFIQIMLKWAVKEGEGGEGFCKAEV
jgi:hypothetical protein